MVLSIIDNDGIKFDLILTVSDVENLSYMAVDIFQMVRDCPSEEVAKKISKSITDKIEKSIHMHIEERFR